MANVWEGGMHWQDRPRALVTTLRHLVDDGTITWAELVQMLQSCSHYAPPDKATGEDKQRANARAMVFRAAALELELMRCTREGVP